MLDNPRHKTAVILGTLSQVPNYPKKLKIYLNNASPYWQAVYWDKGKTYRRSLKTTDKRTAYENAKAFYERIIVAKYQHPAHLKCFTSIDINSAVKSNSNFTLNEITKQWLSRRSVKWSSRHTIDVERRLTNNILKFVGDKSIRQITRPELLGLLQKLEERSAFGMARRVLNDCRQIWLFAIVIEACKHNITIGLNAALHEHTVVHFHAVTPKELPDLMRNIAKYDKESDVIVRYALQLIALTFVRKNELLLAKWDEFDLESAIWKIPANRMKMRLEHVVPLCKQSLKLLNHIKLAYPSNDYVFHKGDSYKPLVDHSLIFGLYWLGYKHRMTVHGFRAIASTILNEQNFKVDVIERQLAHAEPNQVRRAYNRAQYLDERVEMMNWWGDYLDKITPFITA